MGVGGLGGYKLLYFQDREHLFQGAGGSRAPQLGSPGSSAFADVASPATCNCSVFAALHCSYRLMSLPCSDGR